MKWLLSRVGLYCPNMIANYFKYYKGCQVSQKFGDLQMVPAIKLHHINKPWTFRCWGLDFVGEVHPSSFEGYLFVLLAIDYFTKWTKVVALKSTTHEEVIEFVIKHINHRFGIPETFGLVLCPKR